MYVEVEESEKKLYVHKLTINHKKVNISVLHLLRGNVLCTCTLKVEMREISPCIYI